jgi:hypothetical protein
VFPSKLTSAAASLDFPSKPSATGMPPAGISLSPPPPPPPRAPPPPPPRAPRPPARHAHAPCSSRPSHGGLAQRRSQEGQGHGRTRRPRGRWGRATLPTEKLDAAQDWRLGGVDGELVYAFARCCCRLPRGAAAGDFVDHILELPPPVTPAGAALSLSRPPPPGGPAANRS